jgi:plastocyanin
VPGIRAGGEAVRITATDFAYEPNEIRAAPQMPMTITLINRGDSRHSIAFELPAGEPRLEQPIKSGDESQIRFTTPSEPGEYRFYCPVSDHRRRGMTGLLIIEQAPSPTSGDSQ